ncbi:MAG: S8 family serine peptidase, partial [Phycisphaerae bacterium]|nr:S8 family serine peptidase [Phycisphaerae bacterium]
MVAPIAVLLLSVATVVPGKARFVPGQIIVKLRPAAGEEAVQGSGRKSLLPNDLCRLRDRYQLRRIRALRPASREPAGPGRAYRIDVGGLSDAALQAVLEACRRDPAVEYAELNPVVSICAEPNDPLFRSQWALGTIGAAEVWDTCRGSGDVIVALIDTGVDLSHRDLRGNLWVNEVELAGVDGLDDDGNGYIDDIRGYNFAYNNNDPADDHGHGTHCAGTVAAVGNNGLDVTGVCWNARLMPLKVLGADGDGSAADAAVAIYYAVAQGAAVISGSWGSEEESTLLEEAVAYARRQGVLVVAAAGNESSNTPFYPAAYPDVIGVAATQSSDRRWYLSNYGHWVEIAAPGRDILSLRAAGTSAGVARDPFTTKMSGTSMAAPHVAGACALLLSANPFLTVDEVREVLTATGDPIAEGTCVSNARLNVAWAMRAAIPAEGMVRFDRRAYREGEDVTVLVADWDLRGIGAQDVAIETGGGDAEVVTLTETAWARGVLRAVVASENGPPRPGDGRLQVAHGQDIVARYYDADDGFGQAAGFSEAYAEADYEAATILELDVGVHGRAATVQLITSEPARAVVRYGVVPGGGDTLEAESLDLTDHHSIRLGQLAALTQYSFAVVLVDEAGNESVTAGAGQAHSFVTGGSADGLRVPGVYATIQAAIDDAGNGETVWVADGTYTGEGNMDLDFRGKAITLRSENGPLGCIIDCQEEGRAVYFHNGEGADTVLDGFTITNGGDVDYGGGIRCMGSSPTIRNCVFVKNTSWEYGGGLCNCYGSCPTVVACTFRENWCAAAGVFGYGGGMANRHDSRPTVTDCTFEDNHATYRAGGMGNFYGSSPRVVRCTFTGNSAEYSGGAVGNWEGSAATFTQCVFSHNRAEDDGGAVCNESDSDAAFENCIFFANYTDGFSGALKNRRADLTLTNCTIAG